MDEAIEQWCTEERVHQRKEGQVEYEGEILIERTRERCLVAFGNYRNKQVAEGHRPIDKLKGIALKEIVQQLKSSTDNSECKEHCRKILKYLRDDHYDGIALDHVVCDGHKYFFRLPDATYINMKMQQHADP